LPARSSISPASTRPTSRRSPPSSIFRPNGRSRRRSPSR
jgi:hypothetical protein